MMLKDIISSILSAILDKSWPDAETKLEQQQQEQLEYLLSAEHFYQSSFGQEIRRRAVEESKVSMCQSIVTGSADGLVDDIDYPDPEGLSFDEYHSKFADKVWRSLSQDEKNWLIEEATGISAERLKRGPHGHYLDELEKRRDHTKE